MTKKERNRHFINISIGCVLFILGITGISDEYYALMACVGGATFFANGVLPFFQIFIIGRRSEERSMKNGIIKERLTTLTNVKSFFVTKQPTCRICSCG